MSTFLFVLVVGHIQISRILHVGLSAFSAVAVSV